MLFARTILVALVAACTTSAHMKMKSPSPINDPSFERGLKEEFKNHDLKSPIGKDFYPCNTYKFGSGAGVNYDDASVATWAAGSQQHFEIEGEANHNGGSCQASISEDDGNTWKVIAEYIGRCPLDNPYPFTVPKNTKSGKVLFAWSWINHSGGQPEFYMNCAFVTITGGGSGLSGNKNMFVANVPDITTCLIEPGKTVDFTKCEKGEPLPGTVGGPIGDGGSSGSNNAPKTDTPNYTPSIPADNESIGTDREVVAEKPATGKPVAGVIPSPTPAPIFQTKPSVPASPPSGDTSNAASSYSSAGSGADNTRSSSGSAQAYDDGSWSPDKYPSWKPSGKKAKRSIFQIRGLRRGIFGGEA
ncbi:hypothetical protein EX30DRAFT_335319 [Ascodesmis nigricans]|uniref:Lytic polysaccharide monooxygenase n=1 Tax=Ascodesmis nigricans TaxID=341454 RepID=A0A4S2MKX8_9PEZI|nr:hypothetical protein EX30DRAFT_335319 [Ascodesmis nigricans]